MSVILIKIIFTFVVACLMTPKICGRPISLVLLSVGVIGVIGIVEVFGAVVIFAVLWLFLFLRLVLLLFRSLSIPCML